MTSIAKYNNGDTATVIVDGAEKHGIICGYNQEAATYYVSYANGLVRIVGHDDISDVSAAIQGEWTLPPIKYHRGDIVIINENGVSRKRHIYDAAPGITNNDWLYRVDYGLGLTKEGCVSQSNIRCLANETHSLMAL